MSLKLRGISLNILQFNITQIEKCIVSPNIFQFNITQIEGVLYHSISSSLQLFAKKLAMWLK